MLTAGVLLLVVAQDGTRHWALAISTPPGSAAVLVVGLTCGTRRAYLAALSDQARRLEREREQTSALAAAEERARIAREMHDSVAHHLTVIVALSDGALRAVTRAPDEASDAIRDVSGTARQALAETRQLLGVLRADSGHEPAAAAAGPGRPGRSPRPGPGRRPAGPLRTHPHSSAAARLQLPSSGSSSSSLTNTMKHAGPGASAAVWLRLAPAEVHVDVEDDGTGGTAEPGAAGGGLTGMRERISASGGELDFGPRQPQGWRVTARLHPGTAAAS